MRIATIIVTYNRKNLLLECVQSVLAQSTPLTSIYIINNNSTDGTIEFLQTNGILKNKLIKLINLTKNIGGAGGFNLGIQIAYQDGCDYMWLMDDDTIALPSTLEKLFKVYQLLENENIGFVCSHVEWIDQTPHKMNIPHIKLTIQEYPFNYFAKYNYFLIKSCSFVSVLISRYTILYAGFPRAEMFIWGDDLEYFTRISQMKFLGVYVPESIVIHKTHKNENDNIFTLDEKNLWKLSYSVRNNLYIIKKYDGFYAFIKKIFLNLFILSSLILRKKDKIKYKKIKILFINTIKSTKFIKA